MAEGVFAGDDILEAEESRSGDALRELVEARRRPATEADAERPREVRRCMLSEALDQGEVEGGRKVREETEMQPRDESRRGQSVSGCLLVIGITLT